MSVTTALEKARLSSDVPFLALLDIEVLDPATKALIETIRLVANDENITYQGNLYTATKFDLSFTAEGNAAPNVSLSLVDFTQTMQAYMQIYAGGVGFPVTLTVVNAGALTAEPEVQEFFEVQSAGSKDYVANFTLGAASEISQRAPRRRQTKEFCQARYMDPHTCGYGQLWLTALGITDPTTITTTPKLSQLVPSAETPKNTPLVLSAYVSPIRLQEPLYLQVYNKTAGSSIVGSRFSLRANGTINVGSPAVGGWVKTADGLYRVWVFSTAGIVGASDNIQVVMRPADKSSNATIDDITPMGCLQLQFGATQPTAYQHVPGTTPGSTNKLRMSNTLDDALWRDTGGQGYYRVTPVRLNKRYPGANVGTLDDCDLTLQGENGCAAHGNTPNFHGYPGLTSKGVLYG